MKHWYIAFMMLIWGCATSSPMTDNGVPLVSSATLIIIDVPGNLENCGRLIDIEFKIANSSPMAAFAQSRMLSLQKFDDPRYKSLMDRHIKEAMKNQEIYSGESDLAFSYLFGDEQDGFRKAYDEASAKADAEYETLISRERDEQRIAGLKAFNTRKDTSSGAEFGALFVTTNDHFLKHHVKQSNPQTCYAASLATAWKYMGLTATEDVFIERRVPNCSDQKGRPRSASFVEIASTAYSVMTNSKTPIVSWNNAADNTELFKRLEYRLESTPFGLSPSHSFVYLKRPKLSKMVQNIPNYIVTNALLGPQMAALSLLSSGQHNNMDMLNQKIIDENGDILNLYRAYPWKRKNNADIGGELRPITGTNHLLVALMNGSIIMIGLDGASGGHTYLVTGLAHTPDYSYSAKSGITINEGTSIKAIRVLDPALDINPEYWITDTDKFFADYKFGIEIRDDEYTKQRKADGD